MNARQAHASKIQKKIREIITDFPGSLVQFIFCCCLRVAAVTIFLPSLPQAHGKSWIPPAHIPLFSVQ